jgi:hypothetical protein
LSELFHFDEQAHVYTYADVRLPSVTEIIGTEKPPYISWDVWERAAKFGDALHLATAYYDRGVLDESTLDESLYGHFEGWKNFRELLGIHSFLEIEKRVYSLRYWYAGTLDRLFENKSKLILADIKTAVKSEHTSIQCAGYALAYREMYDREIDEYWGVYLKGKGKFEVVNYVPKILIDGKWKQTLRESRTVANKGG